jgi:hypothetical protein
LAWENETDLIDLRVPENPYNRTLADGYTSLLRQIFRTEKDDRAFHALLTGQTSQDRFTVWGIGDIGRGVDIAHSLLDSEGFP